MVSYNVHSHVFTMTNAPKRFLHLYLPDLVADTVDKLTNTSAGAKIFERLLTVFGGNGGKRYASFLGVGKSKSQMDVFEQLLKIYNDPEMKFIALTMNMEYCGAGASASGFEGQIEEILEVKRRYPDRLLIFFGIDPRWKSTGLELKQTVESYFEQKLRINATTSVYPFTGLKLYPSTGFYPFDSNFKETFEWAAGKGVPVLSHCYYHGGIYHNNEAYLRAHLNPPDPYAGNQPYAAPQYLGGRQFSKWLAGRNTSYNNKNTCSYFIEPASCKTMLAYFENQSKPLKFCFAHYGGAEQMLISKGKIRAKPYEDPPYGIAKKNWYEQIRELMTENLKGAYTDVAYTVFDQNVFPFIFEDLNNELYGSKIMFGTDYFLAEPEQPETVTYQKFRNSANEQVNAKTGKTLWQQISADNTAAFLTSAYYQP